MNKAEGRGPDTTAVYRDIAEAAIRDGCRSGHHKATRVEWLLMKPKIVGLTRAFGHSSSVFEPVIARFMPGTKARDMAGLMLDELRQLEDRGRLHKPYRRR